jgi:hypothetical protein
VFIVGLLQIDGDSSPASSDCDTLRPEPWQRRAQDGIMGSSTRQVFRSDAQVPMRTLARLQPPHRLQSVLNIGYFAGRRPPGAKQVPLPEREIRQRAGAVLRCRISGNSVRFAASWRRPSTYAVESIFYRAEPHLPHGAAAFMGRRQRSQRGPLLGAARCEFAVECATLKVEGLIVLDYVVDGVQIYGGYGFSADYPMDRAYRLGINRIFEGNEINRLLAAGHDSEEGLKGEIDPMWPRFQAVQQELLSIPHEPG